MDAPLQVVVEMLARQIRDPLLEAEAEPQSGGLFGGPFGGPARPVGLDQLPRTLAALVKIRDRFGVENDMPPEEEEDAAAEPPPSSRSSVRWRPLRIRRR